MLVVKLPQLPHRSESAIPFVSMPDPDLIEAEAPEVPSAEEFDLHKMREMRDFLFGLTEVACGFKHHFIWENGGKPLPLCDPSARDKNLLCAHSEPVDRLLKRAIAYLETIGVLTPEQGAVCISLASAHKLYDADACAAFSAQVAWGNHCGGPQRSGVWVQERLREFGITRPAEAISAASVTETAYASQQEAGQSRRAIVDLLCVVFERLLANADCEMSTPERIRSYVTTALEPYVTESNDRGDVGLSTNSSESLNTLGIKD